MKNQRMICHFKHCHVCGEVKCLSDFYHNSTRPDGLRPECISCTKLAQSKRNKELMKIPSYRENKRIYQAYRRIVAPWRKKAIYKEAHKRLVAEGYDLTDKCVHHWNYNKLHQVFIVNRKAHSRLHNILELRDDGAFNYKGKEIKFAVMHYAHLYSIYKEMDLKMDIQYVNLKNL